MTIIVFFPQGKIKTVEQRMVEQVAAQHIAKQHNKVSLKKVTIFFILISLF